MPLCPNQGLYTLPKCSTYLFNLKTPDFNRLVEDFVKLFLGYNRDCIEKSTNILNITKKALSDDPLAIQRLLYNSNVAKVSIVTCSKN